jgi:hypothetical protein
MTLQWFISQYLSIDFLTHTRISLQRWSKPIFDTIVEEYTAIDRKVDQEILKNKSL